MHYLVLLVHFQILKATTFKTLKFTQTAFSIVILAC